MTQNNGEQQVMPGGAVHLLDHRQWRFEKFIPTKIQACQLRRALPDCAPRPPKASRSHMRRTTHAWR